MNADNEDIISPMGIYLVGSYFNNLLLLYINSRVSNFVICMLSNVKYCCLFVFFKLDQNHASSSTPSREMLIDKIMLKTLPLFVGNWHM